MKVFRLGVDRLLEDPDLRRQLTGQRLALLAHPASMTRATSGTGGFQHSIDALMACKDLRLVAAFGPQHGMRGEKQDNMVETDDYLDPVHRIPVFSLYGKVRRPTPEMLATFDTILFDVQDVGCRIYTFLTTLLYVLEACAQSGKQVWVLDRPNPAGRPVEGSLLQPGWESFVGSGPLPIRHGLTLGEAANYFVKTRKLDVELKVVPMDGYDPGAAPGFGWPLSELPWVNPSPNAATLNMARAFAGTVLIEGTHLSEGRGTTHPLELVGAPDLDMPAILHEMKTLAPDWLKGCRIRPCFFQPTFHKHVGKMCTGFQIHTDGPVAGPGGTTGGYEHEIFKPYRIIALWLKAIRKVHPAYEIWRDFPYEYETGRLAIDLINGGPALRTWVDNPGAGAHEFDSFLKKDEAAWVETRREFLIYP